MKLSDRDLRSLVTLAVFTACAAYYLFCLDPMLTRRERLLRQAGKEQRRLVDMTRQANELKSWQKDLDLATAQVAAITSGLNAGLAGPQTADVVRGIVGAAQAASLTLTSLQPKALEPTAQGKAPGLSLELSATGTMNAIDAFLGGLGGMEVKALNIVAVQDAQTPGALSLAARLEWLDTAALRRFKLPTTAGAPPPAPKPADDPFAKRPPPATPAPASAPASAPTAPETGTGKTATGAQPAAATGLPATPALDLSGYTLVGIAAVDGRPLAAILHDSPAVCDHFWQGDTLGDCTVTVIDATGVELQNAAGTRARLELPPDLGPVADAAAPAPAAPEAPAGPPPKPGRLGLTLEGLTAESAKARDLDITEGLLITAPRPGDNTLVAGDIILEINGNRVPTMHNAMQAMAEVHAGDDVVLLVHRSGLEKRVVLKALE